jgi:monoamine oxidase
METVAQSFGKLHFAGEHTNFEFLGCTHTALISGAKAAEKIIGLYVKNFTTIALAYYLISTIII